MTRVSGCLEHESDRSAADRDNDQGFPPPGVGEGARGIGPDHRRCNVIPKDGFGFEFGFGFGFALG